MMTIPFFACAISLAFAWRGHRAPAVWVAVAATLALVVLLKLHSTDPLAIEL
ncbi:DUF5993 family protein [Martelella alba]|uniref:DUF5993 family protein n=1 Tax=Martelella alba TaxID=2590451 RepID=UPI0015E8552F|nr:DUF5993 family protein [Martelella alba]